MFDNQLDLFDTQIIEKPSIFNIGCKSDNPDILEYDRYIVSFSGGKDSTALLLFLLENDVPKEKIELWHQDIDGGGPVFMDWEITPDYCRALGAAFGIPVYYQRKEGGFYREMMRNNEKTAPTSFQDIYGNWVTVGGTKGKEGTRLKFPQVSPDLSTRWCSAYLKIDVCATAVRHQERFNDIKTVVLSGERGEESPARAKYKIIEPDRADLRNGKKFRRFVDRWRPIRDWKEQKIWDIIEKYGIRVHPSYYLGWSRCSCKFCIFGNADQFKSAAEVSPCQFSNICGLEEDFGVTLKRKETLTELVSKGSIYPGMSDSQMRTLATSFEYTESIFTNNWVLPSGAFGEGCGPV